MAGPRPKGIRTSDLKSRVMNLAQTSSYAISLQPPRDVLNFLRSRGFTYKTDGKNVELLCSEAYIPGSSLATHDQVGDYYGAREQFAYRRIYDDTFDVQFYVDRNYNTIRFFETWMDYIVGQTGTTNEYKGDTAIYRMSYPKGANGGYKSNIFMTKFEKEITGPALYYTYVGAFPKAMQKAAVSYGPSDILRVNVQFSYIRHVVDTNISSANTDARTSVRNQFTAASLTEQFAAAAEIDAQLNTGRDVPQPPPVADAFRTPFNSRAHTA